MFRMGAEVGPTCECWTRRDTSPSLATSPRSSTPPLRDAERVLSQVSRVETVRTGEEYSSGERGTDLRPELIKCCYRLM